MEHLNCSAVVPMGPTEVGLLNQERNVRGMSSSVNFRMDVYNSMSFDVYVVNRQNMKFKIVRTSAALKGKLAFVKSLGISSMARQDLKNIATTDDISNSKELSFLLEKWSKIQSTSGATHMPSLDQFMYTIDEATLRAKKCFYVRELDVVVCLPDHIDSHPYSHQAQLKNRHTQVRGDLVDVAGGARRFFTWSVFIIDNAGKIGSRWVNIHGSVYQIKSSVDPSSTDGFYVVRNKPVNDAYEHSVPISDFKPTEEELDFPIYKSYQEALAANNSEVLVKLQTVIEERRIKELDLENRLAKAKHDTDKLQDDIQQQIRKNEEAERNHEREMESVREKMRQEKAQSELERERFENEKIKFEHEKVTQGQKNANETIKVIGALLTGIVGLLAIASKWLK